MTFQANQYCALLRQVAQNTAKAKTVVAPLPLEVAMTPLANHFNENLRLTAPEVYLAITVEVLPLPKQALTHLASQRFEKQ